MPRETTATEDLALEVDVLVEQSSVADVLDALVREHGAEVRRLMALLHTCPVCRATYIPRDDDESDPRYCSAQCAWQAAQPCPGCGREGGCACP